MLGSGTKIGKPAAVFASKNTTLVSRSTRSGSSTILPRRLTSVEKDKLKCDHHGVKRHTIATCWAFHRLPNWEKERRHLKREQLGGKATVAATSTSVVDVITRHDHLTATPTPIVTAVSSTPTPLAPMPPLGNFGRTFHDHDTRDTCWIINSGATNHMTNKFLLFFTTLLPNRDHVLIANNVAAPVMRVGSVLLTHALQLDKVLLVPFLSSNLLPVPQVTEELNYVVLMYMSFVLLEDISRLGRSLVVVLKMRLYNVDDVTTSLVFLASPSETSHHRGFGCYIADLILAATRALLLGASVPKRFWMDAVTYVVYLLNRLPS
ncbi:unnamed protein product [Prunus armeniaca]